MAKRRRSGEKVPLKAFPNSSGRARFDLIFRQEFFWQGSTRWPWRGHGRLERDLARDLVEATCITYCRQRLPRAAPQHRPCHQRQHHLGPCICSVPKTPWARPARLNMDFLAGTFLDVFGLRRGWTVLRFAVRELGPRHPQNPRSTPSPPQACEGRISSSYAATHVLCRAL